MRQSTKLALLVGGGVVALVAIIVGGPHVLRHLDFFRIRSVDVRGARYTDPYQIAARLHVDTAASVWDDLRPYEVRAREIPELSGVMVRRRLPGTLVVEVTERVPVALVPDTEASGAGSAEDEAPLVAYDASGAVLPIDVTRGDVDAPVLAHADLAALRLLHALQQDEPNIYAHLSAVRRGSGGEFILTMPSYTVRAASDVDAVRFAELGPITADLARRHITPMEIDLRFRDQVVVRR